MVALQQRAQPVLDPGLLTNQALAMTHQRPQFPHPGLDVTDVLVEQCVDLAAVLRWRITQPQQRPDKPVYVSIKSDLAVAIGETPVKRNDLVSALDALLGDKNLGARARVARLAGLAHLHLEHAEIAQLKAVASLAQAAE